MKNLIRRQTANTIKPNIFWVVLNWLTKLKSFIVLTEEEQEAAGVYLGNRYDHEDQN